MTQQHNGFFDLDEDSAVATTAIDTNADAVPDVVAFDLDQDSVAEAVGVDTNADQVVDTVVFDLDEDSVADVVAVDTDQDGALDTLSGFDLDDDTATTDQLSEDDTRTEEQLEDDSLYTPPDDITTEDVQDAQSDLAHTELMGDYMYSRGVIDYS